MATGVRPLPHFSHSAIGKTTHKRGFAYSHVNYITREDACSKVLAGNMPDSREDGARAFFDREANKDGVAANARIADTFIIALPIELSKQQRHQAVASFMDKIGKGRIAWLAAFHDMGEDEHNPHCHLILRDADVETGRKVLGTTTSAKDVREAEAHGWKVPPRMTSKDLRVAWCEHLNGEMERHGHEARFDARTLKEQGVDREPQIHVGPQASAMAEKGKRFDSQDRRRGDHANVYTLIDAVSRAEHNERIRQANQQRDARIKAALDRIPGQEGVEKRALRQRQSAERKAFYAAQARDRAALREAHGAQKLEQQRWGRKLYAEARERAFQETKQKHAAKWKEVWQTKDAEQREQARVALRAEQKAAYATAAAKLIEQVRPVKNETWQTLKETQDKERQDLKRRHTEEVAALSRQHMAERHALHETWRAQHLAKEAQRVSARLQSQQGMAAVQASAATMISSQAKDRHQHAEPGDAHLAARQFSDRARAAEAARASIRYELETRRQINLIRAGEPAAKRTAPGQLAKQRIRNRAEIAAQRQARQQQSDRQAATKQAFASGRALTSEERASAQGDVRDAMASRDKQRQRERREEAFQSFIQQQNSGRDRGGGRSGR